MSESGRWPILLAIFTVMLLGAILAMSLLMHDLERQLEDSQAKYQTLVAMTNKLNEKSARELRKAQESLAIASATIANQDLLIDILYLKLKEAGIEVKIKEVEK